MPISTESIGAAFISTGLISLVPNILLFLFPQVSAQSNDTVNGHAIFSCGQALAAGGLLGDVFLHALPHAFNDAAHRGDDEGMDRLGVVLLVGFFSFYFVDVLIRVSGAGHSHSSATPSKDAHEPSQSRSEIGLSSAVILNLVADSLHNFTDGLAIGSSYALMKPIDINTSSFMHRALSLITSRGGVVSISVLFHEIPHEMGDFSVLVSHGYTKREAIKLQFVTAIAAFCGTGVGLLAASYEGEKWMLPFNCGGFIYVAAAAILPEVLKEAKGGIKQHVLQLLCFAAGVGFMQAVALLEHAENHHHDHSLIHDHFHDSHRHDKVHNDILHMHDEH